MKLNAIAGLPRSSSTLLCNILNQNPKFWASSTSALPMLVSNVISSWSSSIEIKGELARNKAATEEKMNRTLRRFCDEWHARDDEKEVVFDKSRGWTNNLLALRNIYPASKVLITVRDLRSVFASVEKQHRKNPLLDVAGNPNEKTIFQRASNIFSPNGMIGSCVSGVEDIIRRRLSVQWVKAEDLTANPAEAMAKIYEYLGEEPFEHQYINIENTATDPDAFYNYKYPHDGSGAIKLGNPNEWRQFMNDEMGSMILKRFPLYNSFFGYV